VRRGAHAPAGVGIRPETCAPRARIFLKKGSISLAEAAGSSLLAETHWQQQLETAYWR